MQINEQIYITAFMELTFQLPRLINQWKVWYNVVLKVSYDSEDEELLASSRIMCQKWLFEDVLYD